MGRNLRLNCTIVTFLAAISSASFTPTAKGIQTATSVSDAGVVSQNLNGYTTPDKPKGIPAQPAPGRPAERRYWLTPDQIKILKIRGNSMETGDWRKNDNNEASRRDILPLLPWNRGAWSGNIPDEELPEKVRSALKLVKKSELYGWGEDIPYDDSYFDRGAASVIKHAFPSSNDGDRAGAISARPYDAGLTRYEMWVGKDGQGSAPFAWYFHSYNVVTQGGKILGALNLTTADSMFPDNRSFRDAPYLLDVVEHSEMLRTYSELPTSLAAALPNQSGSILDDRLTLVSQPKMLVLTSPTYSEGLGSQYKEGSASYERKLDELGEQSSFVKPRKYTTDIPGADPSLPNQDNNRQLAPNVGIHDKGPEVLNPQDLTGDAGVLPYNATPLAQNWHYDPNSKKWHFKRWQRSEVLPPNDRSHRWVLETKEDLLFAPQQTGAGTVDPTKFQIIKDANSVSSVANMVVATGQVSSFDTGGFRVGINSQALPNIAGAPYSGIEDIPDTAAINIVPVGGFYPDSAVIVALEYQLKDGKGNPEGPWQTGKIHYWSSKQNDYDSHTQRRITFQSSGSEFDPYDDAWIFPIKDISHTSADYRIRVFMALPVDSTDNDLINLSSSISPSALLPAPSTSGVASTYNATSFSTSALTDLLKRNAQYPLNPATLQLSSEADAINQTLLDSDAGYKQALSRVDLANSAAYTQATSNVASVRQVPTAEVSSVLQSAVFAGASKTLNNEALSATLNPFGKTTWFAYEFARPLTWTVAVPNVNVGIDASSSGVIITE
jgi:hypothetical protein